MPWSVHLCVCVGASTHSRVCIQAPLATSSIPAFIIKKRIIWNQSQMKSGFKPKCPQSVSMASTQVPRQGPWMVITLPMWVITQSLSAQTWVSSRITWKALQTQMMGPTWRAWFRWPAGRLEIWFLTIPQALLMLLVRKPDFENHCPEETWGGRGADTHLPKAEGQPSRGWWHNSPSSFTEGDSQQPPAGC